MTSFNLGRMLTIHSSLIMSLQLVRCAVQVFYIKQIQMFVTWSLILREENKMRVFQNAVFRRIFGPRRDEVMGGMEEIA